MSSKDDDAAAVTMFHAARMVMAHIRSSGLPPGWGATLLFHSGRIEPGGMAIVMDTTLPSRAHVRMLFLEAVARSAVEDRRDGECDLNAVLERDAAQMDAENGRGKHGAS